MEVLGPQAAWDATQVDVPRCEQLVLVHGQLLPLTARRLAEAGATPSSGKAGLRDVVDPACSLPPRADALIADAAVWC